MARPALRLRLATAFPGKIQGTDGVAVDRSGGEATVRQDWAPLANNITFPTPTLHELLLRSTATNSYQTVRADAFAAMFGAIRPFSKLYIEGDSWTGVDAADPQGSTRRAFQDALDAAFPDVYEVVNVGIGGTAISIDVAGIGIAIKDRIGPDIVARANASIVQLQGGINDISLYWNNSLPDCVSEVIAGIQSEIDELDNAGIPWYLCTIGPFKGADFYNTTTRGWVDDINDWIINTPAHAGKVVDLWDLFNDPDDDGAFLAVYRYDDFHPNQAGKIAWANLALSTIDFSDYISEGPAGARATETVYLDQSLRQTDDVTFKSVTVGHDDGSVAPVTIRRADLQSDGPHMALIQRIAADAGWLQSVYDDGAVTFQRIAGGVVQTATLKINFGGPSLHNGQMLIAADAATLDLSSTTFGGGSGVKWRSEPDSSSGWKQTAFSAGGGSLGSATYLATVHIFEPLININAASGNPELQLTRAGVNKIRILHDGTNFTIGVPSLATGVYIADGATSWSALSDRSLKRDFEGIAGEDAATRIAALTWYKYRLKTDADDAPLRSGLIADEVEQVYPELVTIGPGGKKGVEHGGLLPDIAATLKHLISEIEALRQRVAELENAA